MSLGPFEPHAGDLAPGDLAAARANWSEYTLERVDSPSHPTFERVYARLWAEFGAAGEMERREVIESRFAWDPARARGAFAFLYEMIAVWHRGAIVAVRDHTAILAAAGPEPAAFVHLSHVLVEPGYRGRGLAAWLRALPLSAARRCVTAALARRAKGGVPTTLVAEMEPADARVDLVMRRLRSYARAGFLVVDPTAVQYVQPDFRAPEEIDRTSLRALPLSLVVRRVGREQETAIGGDELRALVGALYAMYAEHARADHIAPLTLRLERYPAADRRVELLPPVADL